VSRGNAELVEHRFNGRLESALEPERDVVLHLLSVVFGARLVGEAALAIVVTARDVRVHGQVD